MEKLATSFIFSLSDRYQERQELRSNFLMFTAFSLTAEDAKEYLYSLSTRQPVQRWQNIEVRLYI